jgi:hypothetical protein
MVKVVKARKLAGAVKMAKSGGGGGDTEVLKKVKVVKAVRAKRMESLLLDRVF